jgi:predicted amidohydrolase
MSSLPKNLLRVGVVQTTSTDDVDDNLAQIFSALKKFRGKNLDLVCLPENALFLRLSPGAHAGLF